MTPIQPERLHEIWPAIREGLEAMRARFKSDWLPEDIYAALRNPASLTAAYSVHGGFVVAQRQVHFCGPVLFVWAIHGPLKLANHRLAIQSEIDELARGVGAKKIRMHSPRKGWARCGYRAIETVYEREV